jgi:hypothetical protein
MNLQLNSATAQLVNLSHVGVAVKSVEDSIAVLSSVWNIGTPEIVGRYEPKKEDLLRGEPFAVKLAFIKFGPLTLELLQPLDSRSIWSRFIEEKGEGIHHFALGVSDYDAVFTALEHQGHTLLVAAVYEGCRWCYFDTNPGGVVVEIREEYKKV